MLVLVLRLKKHQQERFEVLQAVLTALELIMISY